MAEKKFSVPDVLPVLPVRDTVLFSRSRASAYGRPGQFAGAGQFIGGGGKTFKRWVAQTGPTH